MDISVIGWKTGKKDIIIDKSRPLWTLRDKVYRNRILGIEFRGWSIQDGKAIKIAGKKGYVALAQQESQQGLIYIAPLEQNWQVLIAYMNDAIDSIPETVPLIVTELLGRITRIPFDYGATGDNWNKLGIDRDRNETAAELYQKVLALKPGNVHYAVDIASQKY